MSDGVRLVPPVDRLDFEEGSLLLYERRLVSLSVLGAAVADLSATPTTVAALAEGLREAFGDPADGSADEATAAVVAALLALGVLEAAPTPDP
nr:hypothetical protein [Propionibacterium sp.]